jgi:undecaprenyl-diphosphatase
MNITQAIILGLLQGATEFLPISSSGHLVLVPWLLGWGDVNDLTFDTTVHLGTLVAVLIYFRTDVWAILRGVFNNLKERNLNDVSGRLGWFILLGTFPAAIIGLLLEDFFEQLFGSPGTVSILLLVTGAILLFSERASQRIREVESITWKDGLLIGVAQAAAIAPGISRSGSTIAAGLALGLKREAAARFSFLLALPIIGGAGLLKLLDAVQIGLAEGQSVLLVIGFLTAAVSGYACIHFLLAYLRERSLYIFTAYCWIFGLFCLALSFVRG